MSILFISLACPSHLFWNIFINNGVMELDRILEVICSSSPPDIKVLCSDISIELIHDQLSSLGSSFLSGGRNLPSVTDLSSFRPLKLPRVSSVPPLHVASRVLNGRQHGPPWVCPSSGTIRSSFSRSACDVAFTSPSCSPTPAWSWVPRAEHTSPYHSRRQWTVTSPSRPLPKQT